MIITPDTPPNGDFARYVEALVEESARRLGLDQLEAGLLSAEQRAIKVRKSDAQQQSLSQAAAGSSPSRDSLSSEPLDEVRSERSQTPRFGLPPVVSQTRRPASKASPSTEPSSHSPTSRAASGAAGNLMQLAIGGLLLLVALMLVLAGLFGAGEDSLILGVFAGLVGLTLARSARRSLRRAQLGVTPALSLPEFSRDRTPAQRSS